MMHVDELTIQDLVCLYIAVASLEDGLISSNEVVPVSLAKVANKLVWGLAALGVQHTQIEDLVRSVWAGEPLVVN
jgi:hypothetical protein